MKLASTEAESQASGPVQDEDDPKSMGYASKEAVVEEAPSGASLRNVESESESLSGMSELQSMVDAARLGEKDSDADLPEGIAHAKPFKRQLDGSPKKEGATVPSL